MRQDSQQALRLLGSVVPGPQRRVQQALVPRDHALDLPAMPVDPLGEPAFHQAAVLRLGSAVPVTAGRYNQKLCMEGMRKAAYSGWDS